MDQNTGRADLTTRRNYVDDSKGWDQWRKTDDENVRLKVENAKLRELAARAWRLFTENGAVHPSDLPEVDAVRDGLRELGVKVDLIND